MSTTVPCPVPMSSNSTAPNAPHPSASTVGTAQIIAPPPPSGQPPDLPSTNETTLPSTISTAVPAVTQQPQQPSTVAPAPVPSSSSVPKPELSPIAPTPLIATTIANLSTSQTTNVVTTTTTAPHRIPVTASTSMMPQKQQQPKALSEPSPVTHLKRLFAQSEAGQRILEQTVVACSAKSIAKPSAACTDAYDLEVVKAIRDSNLEQLRELRDAGRSLDACNRFGESLIHMACRRSNLPLVQYLVEEAGVNLEVRDDFGRSPLHDACWTTLPNLQVMDVLLRHVSPELLLTEDVRGHTPFHYARKEHWEQWERFLAERDELLLRRLSIVALQVVG